MSNSPLLDAETRFRLRSGLEKPGRERTLRCKYVDDVWFYYPSRSEIGIRVSEYGYWQSSLFRDVLERHLQDANRIIEIGANIGADTVVLSKRLPGCEIEAVEPVRKFRDHLVMNLNEAGADNVKVYPLFMSDVDEGTIEINVSSTSASYVATPTSFPTESVETTRQMTLDTFVERESRSSSTSIDFVKIDTDGFDMRVVMGGINTLRRAMPYLWVEFAGRELQDAGCSAESFACLLLDIGYQEFLVVSNKADDPATTVRGEDLIGVVSRLIGTVDVFALRPT